MTTRRTDEQLDEVRDETVKVEKKLKEKRRDRAAKKTEPASTNERLIAPILLVVTILLSYLIVLFSP